MRCSRRDRQAALLSARHTKLFHGIPREIKKLVQAS